MVTIGIYQSLINIALYEHICLENINNLYKYAGKCDDKHQYKAIIEAKMVSTNEVFTENIIISPGPSIFSKNTNASK